MNKRYKTKAFEQYEAGKEYKRKIGLYTTVRTNERFYRGDQWHKSRDEDLPKPVFNIVRRIADYLICSVASSDISIRYTSEDIPFLEKKTDAALLSEYLEGLNKNAAYRWEKNGMSRKIYDALTDAAISGDGVFFCYWDDKAHGSQEFEGDIATEVIDNVNLFVADVNVPDIQAQEYIILAGRKSALSLQNEAREHGVPEEYVKKIVPDSVGNTQSGDLSEYELECEGSEKATYIIKFWRENGKVVFEKSTRDCVIFSAATECKLYPVAYFNWYPSKNSFHGTAAVTSIVPNQKYLNRAYALAMKHMTDTAFSKVVYDKSRIPEWTNGVGEAIAAVGGGNISDAVSVIGTGKMQEHYLDLITDTFNTTKDIMGATESALGDEKARNTSAILALQETSRIPLQQTRSSFHKCIEDLANIWADMMCAYYPSERLLISLEEGETKAFSVDFSTLKTVALSARVDITEINPYSAASAQSMLDKLLDGGYITPREYLKRIPAGLVSEREELLESLKKRENEKGEMSIDE